MLNERNRQLSSFCKYDRKENLTTNTLLRFQEALIDFFIFLELLPLFDEESKISLHPKGGKLSMQCSSVPTENCFLAECILHYAISIMNLLLQICKVGALYLSFFFEAAWISLQS